MEHIKIIQSNTLADREDVSMDIILKLYDIAYNSTLDNTSDLQGRLHVTIGYREPIDWLATNFPNLTIDVDDYIIEFEDENMVTYLNSIGVGSNGIVTEALAAAATVVANSQNTTVTKFNELKYFTQITGSQGSWESGGGGVMEFKNWAALEEVDISNLTYIGHAGYFQVDDTFYGCYTLKKVKASNKLTKFGRSSFLGCSSLEEITGLSGTIMLESSVFHHNFKLNSRSFDNCSIIFYGSEGAAAFKACSTISAITLDDSVKTIPNELFVQCSSLATVTVSPTLTTIGQLAFQGCGSLVNFTIPNTVTTIGANAFDGCTSLSGELNIPALTTLNGYGQYFRNCKSLTKVKCLGKIDTINSGMFANASALQEVYLPYECTIIRNDAFPDCTNLTTIKQYNKSIDQYADDEQPVFNFISRITRFDQLCFKNCSSLTLTANDVINAVTIGVGAFAGSGLSGDLSFPHLETLGSYSFLRCPITSVDLTGSTVTTIGGGFINGSPCDHIILPSTLTKIDGSDNFQSSVLRWVKCPCTTPPTLNNSSCFRNMPNTTKIYVPDASLSTYQSAEIWSNISAQISPLSDFATDFPNG